MTITLLSTTTESFFINDSKILCNNNKFYNLIDKLILRHRKLYSYF